MGGGQGPHQGLPPGRGTVRGGRPGQIWGPVSETAPFYQAATVLALPTLYDPCSNVVLEALACGTLVVTTAANGASEFITPASTGRF